MSGRWGAMLGGILFSLVGGGSASAQLEPVSMGIVQPGGGFLVADGSSVVPLQVVVARPPGSEVVKVRIQARTGQVTDPKVLGPNRAAFLYQCPESKRAVEEVLDVALTLEDGNILSEAFVVSIPPFQAPKLELFAKPEVIDAESPGSVAIVTAATGKDLDGLELFIDSGDLAPYIPLGDATRLSIDTAWAPPRLPTDAPSLLLAMSAATSPTGFAVQELGVSVRAKVQLSVEIPAGTRLAVKGVDQPPPPVPAAADGPTVMNDIPLQYGQRLLAYEVRGSRKNPVSVVLPTGLVPTGVVGALPRQAVADGGTGPTLIVAVPPSPLGGAPFWPKIAVEGAQLVQAQPLGERVQVLSLTRPVEPTTVRVMLDGRLAAEVPFTALRPTQVDITSADPEDDERAAVSVSVKSWGGKIVDGFVPTIRIEGGPRLEAVRTGPGTYRAAIPSTSLESVGDVVAEVPPPHWVAGKGAEPIVARLSVDLPNEVVESLPPRITPLEEESSDFSVGVSGAAVMGTSFGSLLMVGAGVVVDVRATLWGQRFGARTGVEFVYGTGQGLVSFDGSMVAAETILTGVLIPLEVGIVLLEYQRLELSVRGGLALRFEQGGLEVQDDSAGGGGRFGVGARGGLEFGVRLGPGSLFLGMTLDGIGTTLDGLSGGSADLEGSLMNLRGELGYRAWF